MSIEKRYHSEYLGNFRMKIDGEEITVTEMTAKDDKVILWGHKETIRKPNATGIPVVKRKIKKIEMSLEEFLSFFTKVELWYNKIIEEVKR